ncbi:ABC-type Zn uptake system ZnuABC Zn-binding protein ZnuA [Breznakia blatticola]|uniref:ABC-type Zn uptake system ZnuABC Zn-binding protein ZnuA n=1 Tax=Breznakia blatticola TaxID=1754012 RepID=A0A4R7ZES6_9FIRM|nr:metal ABC transporter substrate-binding protein [Breznakia blatticola]TDW16137.1 ABC-type Zn uptake system ZnuABC Zn-binding protein ZnuA [Breznakia blatticola]
MKKLMVCVLFLSCFMMGGCSKNEYQIAVTSYPIKFLVERIGEPHITVESISNGETIQSASITSEYQIILNDSDALLFISGMEPYFEIYGKELRNDAKNYLDLQGYGYFNDFARYTKNSVGTLVQEPYYEGNQFSTINTYTKDPFIWMDPLQMISAAESIRDYMISLYPHLEDDFRKNYDALEIELTNLDAHFQTLKSKEISFVSTTASFGNWQNTYDMHVYPLCLSKFGATPTDDQLEIILQRIRDDGVRYIVHEQNLNPEMEELYQTVRDELGLISIEINNMSALTNEDREENRDYLTIMYENFKVLEGIEN